MIKVGRHLNLSRIPEDSFTAGRYRFRCICLLLLLALFCGGADANTDVQQQAPVTSNGPGSIGPGLSFAIADFDGDHRPDVASVQADRTGFSRSDYWIQLQLTTTGRQSFQVVASIGGLQIAARDVNGDRAVDLVLTTALLSQPVAIFLNDGHGSFSRAEPTAFPEAFTTFEKSLTSSTADEIGDVTAVLPSRDTTGDCSNGSRFTSPGKLAAMLSPSPSRNLPFSAIVSFLGRAPPYFVLHI
jgi:hypothetical protein